MNNFPLTKIRDDFPILKSRINNHQLVYFDNAATTQKPQSVIDGISNYYKSYNANIHRGIHSLAEKATEEFEETRSLVKEFINASSENEIIFTRGTTEGINLISSSLSKFYFNEGDEIIISEMEHHSNIVPWQMIADENKLNLKVINVSENGEIDMDHFKSLISEKTKLVSIVYISNTLGTINPVKKIIEKCKENNILSVVDGAQSSAHKKIDVTDLNCDFYVFSAHKMYGPTGVGVVYGKEEILEKMPPYMGGGEMIKDVSFSNTSYNNLPYKFEAGTPNIGDVIGFKEAINYIKSIGIDNIETYEISLKEYTEDALKKIDGIKVVGTAKDKVGIFSFTTDKVHYYDLGLLLDAKGIALRTGHHCTQPLMDKYSLDGTARLSLAIYNSTEEVDYFVESLSNLIKR
ncbi:MAG: cysteine desulfurase CsdA [Flammeovirgaceae bacterium]|nr:cysteine desulfurase CsdA [Flammeovirgaceae bacterium]